MPGWLARLFASGHERAAGEPGAGDTRAREAAQSEAARHAAAAHLRRGAEAYADGRYADAIGELEAVLEHEPESADAYYRLGLAQHRLGRYEEAADAFVMALHYAPSMTKAYTALAEAQWKQGWIDQALQTIERSIESDGGNPESFKLRAALRVAAGDVPAAVASYEQALALRPDDAPAHASLGYLLFNDCGEYERGCRHLERALALDPDDTIAQCNYTLLLLLHRGDPEAALALCDRLLSRDPAMHEARLNRALAALTLGRFETTWDDYEARKRVRGHYVPRSFPFPEWRGEDPAGKTVFVHSEQGLGDEIMFASCFGDLIDRAGACVIECSARLRALFARSFPRARFVAADAASTSGASERADLHVAAGSLPRFFRRSWVDFPEHSGYLRSDPELQAQWRRRLDALGAGLKVGLAWRGGAVSTRSALRSLELTALAPLFALPGCRFVDLQYGATDADRMKLREAIGSEPQRWPEAIEDLEQCAALMANLDVVISVCTTVVHLAGALGRPVWVMTPRIAEWRYLRSGERMPWYPSASLVRQETPGDWNPVIEEVVRRLRARLEAQ